ncbi:MAG: sulfur transferase domain-containing protein [Nevskiales bacterium]|nr:sulfur transferase domain-containing protein [Nevskiales bacterium]
MNAPLTVREPILPQPLLEPAPLRRLSIWTHSLLKDHAFLRCVFNTRHRVADGLYRSSHPLPYQLREAAACGIRSVINLRGLEPHIGSNVLEWRTCRDLDLKIVHFPMRSRDAPRVEEVIGLNRLYETLEKPILIHCKSGADRAGLASAIYLLMQQGASLEQAMRQLSFWRFGHVRQAKTGVLDHFFETYRAARDQSGIGFEDWLRTAYDRTAVVRSFRENWVAGRFVDWILRRE